MYNYTKRIYLIQIKSDKSLNIQLNIMIFIKFTKEAIGDIGDFFNFTIISYFFHYSKKFIKSNGCLKF